ncbi:MAG: FMN-binding protein [Saccharofermentanales bacterium]
MKNGYVYTIVFMLIISSVFTFFLAGTNEILMPKIQENERLAERRSLLNVFGLDQDGSPEEVFVRFDANIRPAISNGIELYTQIDSTGKILGYAVPFTGAGLWGTISGYLGVSADLKSVLGLVFTSQNETPGLGGRIEEPAYRDQYRSLAIVPDQPLAYGVDNDSQIDAITGATLTSNAVLKILNALLTDTVSRLEVIPGG